MFQKTCSTTQRHELFVTPLYDRWSVRPVGRLPVSIENMASKDEPDATESNGPRYQVVHLADLPAVPCPCGSAKRAFGEASDGVASMHIVEIKEDSELHYHKRMTEFYYVLEGKGYIELDGRRLKVGPGSAVMIKPLCRHRAIGQLKILNVPVPAFDPHDEWFE